MSKGKLAGIIVACTIAIIAAIVLFYIKPWDRLTLSVSVNPPQAGFVFPATGKYKSGIQVTLTANPASSYTFDHWEGDASGTSPTITITMDSDKTLTANFKRQTYTLTISASPSGDGSVFPSSGQYESGAQVTLTASPASGYTFDHWSGDASGTASTITITMDSNKSLTANFKATIQTYTLTVNVSLSGAGSVSPSGGQYESGVSVTLTATPANGYTFDYWSGSASGTASTITITMDSNKSLTANFKTTSAPAQEAIPAEQLLAEYTANEIAADQKYNGKVIEVSGKIDNFGIDLDGNPLVCLYAGFLTDVVCHFDTSWESELGQLQKGQNITVQGICEGIGFINIDVNDCNLISVDGSSP
ncbi:MAG: InlB B-repeat-containing protein [Dehalococcoidia bacterium]